MSSKYFSAIVIATLLLGCKGEESATAQKKVGTKGPSGDASDKPITDPAPETPNSSSPMDTAADDLQQALMKDAGLSKADAAYIVASAKSSASGGTALNLDSKTNTGATSKLLTDTAAAFLSGALEATHSSKVKIKDMDKALTVTGKAMLEILKKLYANYGSLLNTGSSSDSDHVVPDKTVANMKDSVLVGLASEVMSKGMARLSTEQRLADIGALLKGFIKGVGAESLSSAQLSNIFNSLSKAVISSTSQGFAPADLAKLVEASNKALLAGAGTLSGMTAANLALHAQDVMQASITAVAALPGYEKTILPDFIESAAKGTMGGSGSLSKYDAAMAVTVAKGVIQGIVNGIKALGAVNYIALGDKIVSQGVKGAKDGVATIPGLDATALDGLHIDPNEILAQLSSK